MPLPIAHGLVGASVVAALYPTRPEANRFFVPLLVGGFLANCPDLDFFLVWTLHSGAWHRAFTHSIFFAAVVSLVALALLGRSRVREAIVYGLAFMSHGVLDYLTTKEAGGVQLLWPASTERLKLGAVGIIEVPSRFTVAELMTAFSVELALFTPLLIAVLFIRRYGRGKDDPVTQNTN